MLLSEPLSNINEDGSKTVYKFDSRSLYWFPFRTVWRRVDSTCSSGQDFLHCDFLISNDFRISLQIVHDISAVLSCFLASSVASAVLGWNCPVGVVWS